MVKRKAKDAGHCSGRCVKRITLLFIAGYLMLCGSCSNPLSDILNKIRYEYGDTGPGGGIVIDFNYIDDGWYYTEIAPAGWYLGGDDPQVEWGAYGTFIGVTGEEYGAGVGNTRLIVEALNAIPESGRAAQLCDEYESLYNGKTYSDWVLPSEGTMERLHNMDMQIDGIFMDDAYWTSSEVDAGMAVSTVISSDNYEDYQYKNVSCRVRPVRFF